MAWAGFKRAISEDPVGVAAVLGITLPITSRRDAGAPRITSQDELAYIIEHESGWRPAAENPTTHASGLIQFMPATAVSFGTTVEAIRGMSRAEQAPLIERYFARAAMGVPMGSGTHFEADNPGDLYLLVFSPAHAADPDDATIYEVDSAAWRQNPSLREPGGGPITAGSVRNIIRNMPTPVPQLPPNVTPPAPPASAAAPWWLVFVALAAMFLGERKRRRRA